jgi:Skp family chaperone for outer membrane proteins
MKLTTFILLAVLSFNLNAAGKSAFINSKVLLEKSPQAIAANTELQKQFGEREQSKQFGEREQSLRNLAKSIQEMEQTYKSDSAVMSDEQKKKAEDNIIQNKRRFQFEQFTDSSIAYASDAVNITDEILEELKK